ncbi:hypothetical protein H9P43_001601 [Blastocladiella emersonii ATCC 22665]|nr:hypothetical protein H9P43_001601 [Blastocladiella emersonii ATCC 22665]
MYSSYRDPLYTSYTAATAGNGDDKKAAAGSHRPRNTSGGSASGTGHHHHHGHSHGRSKDKEKEKGKDGSFPSPSPAHSPDPASVSAGSAPTAAATTTIPDSPPAAFDATNTIADPMLREQYETALATAKDAWRLGLGELTALDQLLATLEEIRAVQAAPPPVVSLSRSSSDAAPPSEPTGLPTVESTDSEVELPPRSPESQKSLGRSQSMPQKTVDRPTVAVLAAYPSEEPVAALPESRRTSMDRRPSTMDRRPSIDQRSSLERRSSRGESIPHLDARSPGIGARPAPVASVASYSTSSVLGGSTGWTSQSSFVTSRLPVSTSIFDRSPSAPRSPAPSRDATPLLGDAYSVIKSLGEGSFGSIKLATHVASGQKVAIKQINRITVRRSSAATRMVLAELVTLLTLDVVHANVISLLDVFMSSSTLYLVTRHVPGGDLFEWLRKKPSSKVTQGEARRLFVQLVSAVAYCHGLGICHRDIKLENILIDDRDQIQLIDFGLAAPISDQPLTQHVGSGCYASPEMVKRVPYHGPDVDVWSLGVLLFALCCGRFPFRGDAPSDLARAIKLGEYKFPSKVQTSASWATYRDLVAQCLEMDGDKRISVSDLANHPWMSEASGSATPITAPCSCKGSMTLLDQDDEALPASPSPPVLPDPAAAPVTTSTPPEVAPGPSSSAAVTSDQPMLEPAAQALVPPKSPALERIRLGSPGSARSRSLDGLRAPPSPTTQRAIDAARLLSKASEAPCNTAAATADNLVGTEPVGVSLAAMDPERSQSQSAVAGVSALAQSLDLAQVTAETLAAVAGPAVELGTMATRGGRTAVPMPAMPTAAVPGSRADLANRCGLACRMAEYPGPLLAGAMLREMAAGAKRVAATERRAGGRRESIAHI